MRTTLNLDDDVLAAARAIARAEQNGLGTVLSRLARRGLRPDASRVSYEGRIPVFKVPPDALPITDEMIQAALDDD